MLVGQVWVTERDSLMLCRPVSYDPTRHYDQHLVDLSDSAVRRMLREESL